MLDSSIWRQDATVCKVWMTLLLMKDQRGRVEASVGGLADRSKVTVEEAERALKSFLSPDPDSKSKNDEGRRIREVEGGWLLINHEKYAVAKDEEEAVIRKAILTRERQRKCREKKASKKVSPVTDVTLGHARSRERRDTERVPTEETAQPALFALEPERPAETPASNAEKARSKRLPESDAAKRLATLFRRRHTTPWTKDEIAAFLAIGPIDPDDLTVIEAYYARERAKGDHRDTGGVHRRDLKTFLNNYAGELDRARLSAPPRKNPTHEEPPGWPAFVASIGRPEFKTYREAPGFLQKDFRGSEFAKKV